MSLTAWVERRRNESVGIRGIVGRIWPDGAFGFSYSSNARQEARTYDERRLENIYALESKRPYRCDKYNGFESDDQTGGAIGLSVPSNSHSQNSAPRGHKGITGYGRKMVSSAATILQRRHGKGKLGFLTMTLPEMNPSDWYVVAAEWSEVVRVFLQWLQRTLKALGLSGQVVCVTEIQTERLKSTTVKPTYHLHALFQASVRDYQKLLSPSRVRLAWQRAWESRLSGTYRWNASENLKYVKKSASGYLAKYMSKGTEHIEELVNAGFAVPHTWWNMTAGMRSEVKKHILTGESAMTWLECHLPVLHPDTFQPNGRINWFAPVQIELDTGQFRTVGYRGQLTAQGRDEIYRVLDRTFWCS